MAEENKGIEQGNDHGAGEQEADRRDFLQKAGSVCAGCALVGTPVVAGMAVVADPLRLPPDDPEFLKVAKLDALPSDGTPQKFVVKNDKIDAWSRFPDRVIGAVYLRRLENNEIQAFNVVCPHLGCAINYREEQHDYFCPCHDSAFALEDGEQGPGSPSARPLDSLEAEVRNENEVWVKFQNFQTGVAEKKPA
ncbi:MAG: Rieske 2Fe-2S domain-containing protein [Verrucomicrobiales bacterium]|nr:Rieske 2Fe-2S domain-containing protein [Verrucomicrobiales bacterium]